MTDNNNELTSQAAQTTEPNHPVTQYPTDKKILYFDMDNVLVDFQSAFKHLTEQQLEEYADNLDEIHGIFSLMQPMQGAVDAFKQLAELYDVYILSTAPYNNPSAWSDKVKWVQQHLGDTAFKRLILSHNKHLNAGDYLIDDRPTKNGADHFTGEVVPFGLKNYCADWPTTVRYMKSRLDYLDANQLTKNHHERT